MKITKKIKNIFNGRKWNGVRTRKKMLFFSIFMAFICFGIECGLSVFDHHIESTLISEWFSYAKWLCGGGLALSLAEVATDKVGNIIRTIKDAQNGSGELEEVSAAETNME